MKRVKTIPSSSPATRCGQTLWVLVDTLECASSACVSCAHKILSGQHELLVASKANVRPELCPRNSKRKPGPRMGLIPLEGASILTVGDGDLSFSVSLACTIKDPKLLVATTYEPRENLARSYPKTGLSNIAKLQKLGCQVLHGVDAEKLTVEMFAGEGRRGFDFVIFNFPCVAVDDTPGLDGQLQELQRNQQLLQRFGECVPELLTPVTGQVHVTHKTKAAFQHWQVAECVLSAGKLESAGALVFDRCVFPGYVNRKVRDAKSFPMTDAVTFMFKNAKDEEEEQEGLVWGGNEDTLAGLCERARKAGASRVLVTDELLLQVNRTLL
ncbi:hypothetical protein BASA82_000161 [Batrachochytrium salamandrivorans]|nr:hypothetical protein BASA82_000161 [Batrachochytrium salamandrivorans]